MPYIGRSTDGFGVRNRFLFVASASDTSVSGADANGATLTFTDGAYVDVYLNGVLLKAGTDYNTNTANTIAGLSALSANDEVTVIVYDVFTVADTVSASSGGTFSGGINITTGSSGASADSNVDELVVQGSGRSGISILTPDANDGQLVFGSPSDNIGAFISYKQSTATMELGTSLSNGLVKVNTGDGSLHTTFEADGDVNINNGNLVIGTSGKGIDFSAQTGGLAVASGDGTENPTTENEVLKHYEHGTFKPKVVSSGATFDYQGSGGQYGSGHYTRIGDIVFIDINLDSDGGVSGTTSNSVQIQNLPFTGHTGTSMNIQYFYRRVSSSTYPHIMAQQYDNYISFLQSPDSGQWRSLPASEINFSDHRMKISGCYHIGTV